MRRLGPGTELEVARDPNLGSVVRGKWRDIELYFYQDLAFDETHGRLSRTADELVPFFELQIAALRDLLEPQRISIRLDPLYDDQLTYEPQKLRVFEVDENEHTVIVSSMARLNRDPRAGTSFQFIGTRAGDTWTATPAARAAFDEYLQSLQIFQADAIRQRKGDSGRPPATRYIIPPGFTGGPVLRVTAHTPDGESIQEWTWDAHRLTYRPQ